MIDYLGLNATLYEWADSYDSKDWVRHSSIYEPHLKSASLPLRRLMSSLCSEKGKRMAGVLTFWPFLQIDYRSFLDKLWEAMPAEEYLQMVSDQSVLGNPLLRTQHLIGGTR